MRRLIQRMVLLAVVVSLSLVLLTTVIGNSGNDQHDEPSTDSCDCAKNPSAGAAIRAVPVVNPNANRFKNCKDTDRNSSVQRAIVIYYPSHQHEYFFPEVRW